MIYRLPDNDVWFPDPFSIPEDQRESDGCYAVGGDLSPLRLLEAYSQGIFPWSDFRSEDLYWYCPMQRFVLFPDRVHVSHSMRTVLNKDTFRVSFDHDFSTVIRLCSAQRIDMPGAWLGPEMVEAYTSLHEMGYAHSVEVWHGDEIVGGLYGVWVLNVFCGESMVSLVPNASKVALIYLCQMLREYPDAFIDCQFETPHLRSMGGCHIPYFDYLKLVWRNHQ